MRKMRRRRAAAGHHMCEPLGVLARVLDQLRWVFPYAVAFFLPLAGVLLAVVRYNEGDRSDAVWVAACAVLGTVLIYVPLLLL